MRANKKYRWLLPLLAAVLLAGCGSSAPAEPTPVPDNTAPNTTDSPTLIVKNEENPAAPDFSGAQPSGSNEDLLTMTSEEEVGFALFCPILSETQFRDMLQRDGVDLVPDRFTQVEGRYFAYYNSSEQPLIVCDSALQWFRCIRTGDGTAESRVMDALWLNENCLMILSGSETQQLLYSYQPEEQTLQCVYTSPEDMVILGIAITEDGEVECTIAERALETVLTESVQLEVPQADGAAEGSAEPVEEAVPEEPATQTVRVPVPTN